MKEPKRILIAGHVTCGLVAQRDVRLARDSKDWVFIAERVIKCPVSTNPVVLRVFSMASSLDARKIKAVSHCHALEVLSVPLLNSITTRSDVYALVNLSAAIREAATVAPTKADRISRPAVSIAALRRMAKTAACRVAACKATRLVTIAEAPVRGTDDIHFLATLQALIEEGREQDLCLKEPVVALTYAAWIRAGRTALYRVWRPERCTLELYRTKEGAWNLWSLRGRDNAPPDKASYECVRQWLEPTGQSCMQESSRDRELPF